ncbi:MAG: hypothetical protein IJ524_08470 [Bacteroidales bacterium]|nr:hypothetical protein [Bacteroidales bacterium]
MKKATFTIAMLTLLSCGALQAQNTISLRFGGIMPTSDYADVMADYSNDVLRYGLVDNAKKGGAGMGLTAGVQARFGVKSVSGLGIIVSGDVFFNSTNSDVSDYFEDFVDDNESSTREISVTTPVYFQIPLLVGLNYTYDLKDNIAIYGEGGIGANVRILTDFELYQATATQEQINTLGYDIATTFAFKVGAGVVFGKKYSLGIDFYNHGTAKATGEETREVNGVTQSGTQNFKGGKITGTNVALRFGINF